MADRAKLMLVGRHKLFRECLASMLEEDGGLSVGAQVDDLERALELIPRHRPDVLLVDLGRPSRTTLERLRAVSRAEPPVKVVVLGLPEVEDDVLRCIEAGASGYVLKESSLEDLRRAIGSVTKGEATCAPQLTRSLFQRLAELARDQRTSERRAAFDLTPREVEILELIADGMSNKEIASTLCLSLYTVKNHVHHILEKLQVQHRNEAVEQAYKRRWLRERRRASRPVVDRRRYKRPPRAPS